MSNKLKLFNERKHCPVCNHRHCKDIIRLEWNSQVLVDFFNYRNYPIDFIKEGAYVLLECKKCSLLYQKYNPNKFLLDKLYNKWIRKRNSEENNFLDYGFNPYSPRKTIGNISEINQILNIIIDSSDNSRVLDFGMGWGGWCRAAQLMGLEAYGSEISQSQIEYNERNGLKVIGWNEITNFGFSFINAEQVFEPLADPFDVLKHLIGGLKPNGFLRISVPNATGVKSNFRKNYQANWFYAKGKNYSLNPVEPLQHLNGFNYKSLICMGEKLGLKESKFSIGRIQKNSILPSSFFNSSITFFRPFLPLYIYMRSRRTNVLFQKA